MSDPGWIKELERSLNSDPFMVEISFKLTRSDVEQVVNGIHNMQKEIKRLRVNQIPGYCKDCGFHTDNSDNDDVDFCDKWMDGTIPKGHCHEWKPKEEKPNE